MPKLTVIIPKSQEGELTREWAEDELISIDHEILMPSFWKTGLRKAKGDYVCFLEKDCVLSPRYFTSLMEQFVDKPSYRKLAMVVPSTGVNSWEKRLYGYRLAYEDVYPSYIPSSNSPYLVQIGFIPGAIIRRSAMQEFIPQPQQIILDSANLSLRMWASGQRITMVPSVTYVSSDSKLDNSFWFSHEKRLLEHSREVGILFKREAIG